MNRIIIFLYKLFGAEMPEPGQEWDLSCEVGGPFPHHRKGSTVLEVRDGWVRYKIGSGQIYDNERMKLSTWLIIFKRVRNPQAETGCL